MVGKTHPDPSSCRQRIGCRLRAALLVVALLLDSGVFATVIGDFKAPDDPRLDATRELIEQGKFSAARDLAMEVLEGDVRRPEALDVLTTAYAATRARGLPRADEIGLRAREIADYTTLLKHSPEWRDLLFRSATQRLDLQRLLDNDDKRREVQLVAAIDELTRLVRLIDVGNDAVIERASALYQLGRALRLAADFLAVGKREPERRAQFYDRAHTALAHAFEIDPSRVDAVGELMRVELARKDVDAALNAINSRIDKASSTNGRARLHVLRGDLQLQAKRPGQALDDFNAALALDLRAVEGWLGLYRVHLLRQDVEQADAAMRNAVNAAPDFVFGHLKLGEMSAARSDYASAVGHFERALAVPTARALVLGMNPSRNAYRNELYYQAAAWLAWLYLEHGKDPRRALAAVAHAAQFRPVDARLADTQGWIYFQLGDYAHARKALELVVAGTSGDFPAVHYHLARTYAALGDHAAARRALHRALGFDAPFTERAAAEAFADKLK